MSTKQKLICRHCGGDNVVVDAYAVWNVDLQAFELLSTFDKGHFCEDCDGECRYDFVAIEETPPGVIFKDDAIHGADGRILYVVDGASHEDEDPDEAPLFMADGQFAPFVVFDVERQENLPGRYNTRAEAEAAMRAHVGLGDDA